MEAEVSSGLPTLPAMFPEFPEILWLDNKEGARRNAGDDAGEPPRSGNRWHTDVTLSLTPPVASLLKAVVVPPYGGDTQWTTPEHGYERLSPAVQAFIDGFHAVRRNVLLVERGEMPVDPAGNLSREFAVS